jgi:hypothetical protein
MKVELEKIRLGMAAISEDIIIGIPSKDKISFNHKKVVTSDFIKTVIDWCGIHKRTITGGGCKWEITVKKLN